MFQGTGSDVGKSLLVAGIARALTRRGFSVAPFKPQNMSNNAAVTTDGGEIGRAQALQARACGLAPSVHMNPVLLKPQSEIGAQVVVQGKVIGNANAREYQSVKPTLMPAVLESYHHLAARADIVLVTDGQASLPEPWINDFQHFRRRRECHALGIVIDVDAHSLPVLERICDGIVRVSDLTAGNARAVFAAFDA